MQIATRRDDDVHAVNSTWSDAIFCCPFQVVSYHEAANRIFFFFFFGRCFCLIDDVSWWFRMWFSVLCIYLSFRCAIVVMCQWCACVYTWYKLSDAFSFIEVFRNFARRAVPDLSTPICLLSVYFDQSRWSCCWHIVLGEYRVCAVYDSFHRQHMGRDTANNCDQLTAYKTSLHKTSQH